MLLNFREDSLADLFVLKEWLYNTDRLFDMQKANHHVSELSIWNL